MSGAWPYPAQPIVLTGVAGFIGFHLARRLLQDGRPVVGIDNMDAYYDVDLKKARLAQLDGFNNFRFVEMSIEDGEALGRLTADTKPAVFVNMAAQAGVRHSVNRPHAYIGANVVGFLNVLEACRQNQVPHLVYASSSSVYGTDGRMPLSTHQSADHPLSLYAATKKADELMAHSYSHLYGLPTTGLRLFSVYGPWGRPDMAVFRFTASIVESRAIDVFNHGDMQRDFTYIDDVVESTVRLLARIPTGNPDWSATDPDPSSSRAPFKIYNIGNNRPVPLMRVIELLESQLGRRAEKRFLPMQPGDVRVTYSDNEDLVRAIDYQPSTPVETGIERFVAWYRDFYRC